MYYKGNSTYTIRKEIDLPQDISKRAEKILNLLLTSAKRGKGSKDISDRMMPPFTA